MRFLTCFTALVLTAASDCIHAESPIASGAKLEKLSDGFKFTEGPTADAQGNVYFTDQPNNRIHKWSVDGQLSIFWSLRAARMACALTRRACCGRARMSTTSCGRSIPPQNNTRSW